MKRIVRKIMNHEPDGEDVQIGRMVIQSGRATVVLEGDAEHEEFCGMAAALNNVRHVRGFPWAYLDY